MPGFYNLDHVSRYLMKILLPDGEKSGKIVEKKSGKDEEIF
jgi:hypothetical protein